VFNVSWDDAKLYVKWLSNKTGKRYRLLSEAEWEYAARAGSTTTSYFFGSDPRGLCKYANIADESARGDIQPHGYGSWIMCNDGYFRTAPVGRFAPNQFGLYDMLGNVSEWVEDVWHGSYEGAPSDGTAWLVGGDPGYRIARGGNFFDVDYGVRLEFRANHPAGTLGSLIGFRVARELEQ
jgi:formylglycine-generating enzyme required for sulfatase activity